MRLEKVLRNHVGSQRLFVDGVHTSIFSPIDVELLSVTSYGKDLGNLGHGSDLLGGFIAIKNRHLTVHKYNFKITNASFLYIFFDKIHGFLTVSGDIGEDPLVESE